MLMLLGLGESDPCAADPTDPICLAYYQDQTSPPYQDQTSPPYQDQVSQSYSTNPRNRFITAAGIDTNFIPPSRTVDTTPTTPHTTTPGRSAASASMIKGISNTTLALIGVVGLAGVMLYLRSDKV